MNRMKPILLSFLLTATALADERSFLTVRELAAQGQHYQALVRYSELEESDRPLAEKLAAARSAWALGLSDRARELWDESLAFPGFQGEERARELLSRSILELQEGHFEEARSIAEKTLAKLEVSPLRAQFLLVIAEALSGQGASSQAESYYKRAVEESAPESRGEASFLLGECQLKLGLMNDARYNFANVESRSKYSARALRRLTEIDLTQKNFEGVLTWIDEGRAQAAEDFEDTWIGYARISALIELDRVENAKEELERIRVRYSEKDPWVALANAKCEAGLAGKRDAQIQTARADL